MKTTAIAFFTALACGPVLAQDHPAHVYLGRLSCESKQTVSLRADPDQPGAYVLNFKKFVFHMRSVSTPSGAVRLEDPKAGVIWIQLNSKSMLMDQQRGVRLVDECQHPTQEAMAQAMKTSPAASLLADEPGR